MSDFTVKVGYPVPTSILGSMSEGSLLNDVIPCTGSTANAAAAWPAVNLALYFPVVVSTPVTVYQMGLEVGTTASGNVDVGIYDYLGKKLVSATPTAIGGSGAIQTFDITDTALVPGVYFLAAWCSTTTTATFQRATVNTVLGRVSGCGQEASLASGLGTTATIAAYTSSYVPTLVAMFTGNFY